MKDLGKTEIGINIRVSSACIELPIDLHYGSYFQYETWVFVNPPARSRQIIVGASHYESDKLEQLTMRLHNRVSKVLQRNRDKNQN